MVYARVLKRTSHNCQITYEQNNYYDVFVLVYEK